MKIDWDYEFKNKNEAIKMADGKPMTLLEAFGQVCYSFDPQNKRSGDESYALHKLLKKAEKDKDADFSHEEVVKIKNLFGTSATPLVQCQAWDVLESEKE